MCQSRSNAVGSHNAKNFRLFLRSSTTHYDDNKKATVKQPSKATGEWRDVPVYPGCRKGAAAETNWLTQSCQLRRIHSVSHSRTLNLKRKSTPVGFPSGSRGEAGYIVASRMRAANDPHCQLDCTVLAINLCNDSH